jgi:pimeloyl-ACP methyl ester carboxylesterase
MNNLAHSAKTPGSLTAREVSSTTTRSRRIWKGFKRVLKGLGLALIVLIIFGLVAQTIATEADKRNFPPPGQLVDVGGYRLHLMVNGQEHAGPTVILDAGLGIPAIYLSRLQAEIAPFARVVMYDRPGTGWSDDAPADQARDALSTARALHTALVNASIPGPYVVVGHSTGGLNMLVFAHEFPTETAGVVLVDSSHPEQFQRYGPDHAGDKDLTLMMARGMSLVSRLGILRLSNAADLFEAHDLTTREQAELQMFYATPRLWDGVLAEMEAWQSSSIAQVKQAQLGDMPLLVLTASETAKAIPLQVQLHDELAALSTNSAHHVIDGATHGGMTHEHASEIAAAVQDVLDAASSHLALK